MLKNFLILVPILGSCSVAVGETTKPIAIIEFSSSFSRGTLPRQGVWEGLYCKESECEIRKAPVRITSSKAENVLGEKEPIDVLNISDDPMAIFHNAPLHNGKVTTWFVATKPMYESTHYSKLLKLGRWEMPWGDTPLTISWVRLPDEGGFRFHLGDGTTKQFLFRTAHIGHYGGDTAPFIHWVGDLDGDNKIDLILSLPDDNCGFDGRLYLSSKAENGEFVHKSAQLSGSEAACGC